MWLWDHSRAAGEEAENAERARAERKKRTVDPSRRTMTQSFIVVTRAEREKLRREEAKAG